METSDLITTIVVFFGVWAIIIFIMGFIAKDIFYLTSAIFLLIISIFIVYLNRLIKW